MRSSQLRSGSALHIDKQQQPEMLHSCSSRALVPHHLARDRSKGEDSRGVSAPVMLGSVWAAQEKQRASRGLLGIMICTTKVKGASECLHMGARFFSVDEPFQCAKMCMFAKKKSTTAWVRQLHAGR